MVKVIPSKFFSVSRLPACGVQIIEMHLNVFLVQEDMIIPFAHINPLLDFFVFFPLLFHWSIWSVNRLPSLQSNNPVQLHWRGKQGQEKARLAQIQTPFVGEGLEVLSELA